MPTTGTYGNDHHRQRWIFAELIPRELMPPRDVPMPTWKIHDGGRDVLVTGSYDTIWYAARVGGAAARDAIEDGIEEITIAAKHDVTVTLTIS